ncbi:MAG: transporter substrate-binding domain-containing protein [Pseudomonas sp.]
MLLLLPRSAAASLAGLLVLLLLCGCNRWPEDPRNSLSAAEQRGTLRVGVIASPPWVELSDPAAPGGLEAELVSEFAAQSGMQVEWQHQGIEHQVEALKNVELDLLIGGFSTANPWKAEVGQTFVYFREHGQTGSLGEHVLLTAPGENALLMSLERFLFSRQQPERYLSRLREAEQP